MSKLFYVVNFLTCFTLGVGAMFEFLHWPFAGIILFVAFLFLNLGLIPMYFYHKLKNS